MQHIQWIVFSDVISRVYRRVELDRLQKKSSTSMISSKSEGTHIGCIERSPARREATRTLQAASPA